MKRALIGFALIAASAFITVKVLAECGSYFQPEKEDTFSGEAICGLYGPTTKTAHWRLFYTNGHETHDVQVTEDASCFLSTGLHDCYPGYDWPTWSPVSTKTVWNQVTHSPSYIHTQGGCQYDSPSKTDHKVTYYCHAEEVETEEACEENGWYWNFTSSSCQTTPSTQAQCYTADWYWNFTNSTCGQTPAIGMCGGGADWQTYTSGCYTGLGLFTGSCGRSTNFINKCYQDFGDYDTHYCTCTGCDWCGGSPILIDLKGDGFEMTDVSHGVRFDLNGNRTLDKLSWTAAGSDEAWLTLDRNRDGLIDSGKELFGNFTFQAEASTGVERNGFLALAEYDKAENGGNEDNSMDQRDAAFSRLRLWQDSNHDGIADAAELHALPEFGVESISLDYREARRTDRYGNSFKYRAKLYGANHRDLGRWAYDVYLLSAQ
jgi:hypothetical protein